MLAGYNQYQGTWHVSCRMVLMPHEPSTPENYVIIFVVWDDVPKEGIDCYYRREFIMADYQKTLGPSVVTNEWTRSLDSKEYKELRELWTGLMNLCKNPSVQYASGTFYSMAGKLPGMSLQVDHPAPTRVYHGHIVGEMCGYPKQSTLSVMIQHLNDSHHWTRDQIADWVETLNEVPVFGVKK